MTPTCMNQFFVESVLERDLMAIFDADLEDHTFRPWHPYT